MVGPLARRFNVKAVGVTFVDDYPAVFTRLASAVERAVPKKLDARLVRERDNLHDVNAIAVDVPEVGRIGHVPRTLAERLAPHLDAGESWRCQIAAVLIHPDHREHPGIDLLIEKVA